MTSPEGYPPPQYPYYPPPPAPPQYPPLKPATSGFAIASFVLGLLGVVLLSVIFGIIGLVQTKGGQRKGRGLAVAGLAISALWVIAVAAVVAIFVIKERGTVAAEDLTVGTCIGDFPSGGNHVADVKSTPCDQPHRGEVFAVLPIPDAPSYPGEAKIRSHAEQCRPALEQYAPKVPDTETIDLYYLYPSVETWAHGDREFVCIYGSETPSTGSIR